MKIRICIDPLLIVREWSEALDSIDYVNSVAAWDEVARDFVFVALEVDRCSYAEYCSRLAELEAQRSGWRKDAVRVVLGFVSRRVFAPDLEGDVAGEFVEPTELGDSVLWTPQMRAEFCDLLADASLKGDIDLPRGTIATTTAGPGVRQGLESVGIRALQGDAITVARCRVTRDRAELLELLNLPDPVLISELKVAAVPETVYEKSGHQPTARQKWLIEQVAKRSGIVVRAGTTYFNPNGKVRHSSVSRTDQNNEVGFTIVDEANVVKGVYSTRATDYAESAAAHRHIQLTLLTVLAEG